MATATHPPFLSTSILARTALMPANGDTGKSVGDGPARRPDDEQTDDAGQTDGDVANLFEVLGHLHDRLPVPTPTELRRRPRVALARPVHPPVGAPVSRAAIA